MANMKKYLSFVVKGIVLVVIFAFLSLCLTQPSYGTEFEDLVSLYESKEAGESDGLKLQERLLQQAPKDMSQYDMWESLFNKDLNDEKRASIALRLISELFPQGDPALWSSIEGLWIPQMVPKPLAALDAVYVAIGSLLSMDEKGAPWLARSIFLRLYESREARIYGIRTAPVEVVKIIEEIKTKAPLAPLGGWPTPNVVGNLPFACKIYGYISVDTALSYNMTFLDSMGRPRGGSGLYAWDRARGRIYIVRSGPSEDEIWSPF